VSSDEVEELSESTEGENDTEEWLPAIFPINGKIVWVVLWALAAREIASIAAGCFAVFHSPEGTFFTTPQHVGHILNQLGAFGDGVGVLLVSATFVLSWVIFVLRGGIDAVDVDPKDVSRVRAQLLWCAVLSASASIGALLLVAGTVLYYGQYEDRWVRFMSPGVFYVGYAVLSGVVTFIVLRLRRSIEPVPFES